MNLTRLNKLTKNDDLSESKRYEQKMRFWLLISIAFADYANEKQLRGLIESILEENGYSRSEFSHLGKLGWNFELGG